MTRVSHCRDSENGPLLRIPSPPASPVMPDPYRMV